MMYPYWVRAWYSARHSAVKRAGGAIHPCPTYVGPRSMREGRKEDRKGSIQAGKVGFSGVGYLHRGPLPVLLGPQGTSLRTASTL